MFPQPRTQSIIHARLPSASSRFERGQYILIEADSRGGLRSLRFGPSPFKRLTEGCLPFLWSDFLAANVPLAAIKVFVGQLRNLVVLLGLDSMRICLGKITAQRALHIVRFLFHWLSSYKRCGEHHHAPRIRLLSGAKPTLRNRPCAFRHSLSGHPRIQTWLRQIPPPRPRNRVLFPRGSWPASPDRRLSSRIYCTNNNWPSQAFSSIPKPKMK